MKRLLTLVLALTVLLGQAPAWALANRCMPMDATGLNCLRVCAKSRDLLTQHGKLPSVGQACARVETRFAQPSLSAVSLTELSIPLLAFCAAPSAAVQVQPSVAIARRAHAPPSTPVLQAILSVPLAQGPPALV